MKSVDVEVCLEDEDLMPVYASEEAAGADLRASIQSELVLAPGESRLIPTGIRVAIPKGYEIQVRPRSGLALKNQVSVLNTPGTIDSDYRGEIGVILINHSKNEFVVKPRMRIAQMVLAPVCQASFVQMSELTETVRGDGGFGHSGVL